MKILFVHPLDVLYTPTTVRFLLHAKALQQRGHEITLVYFAEPRRAHDAPIRARKDLSIESVELGPFQVVRNVVKLILLAKRHDIIHLEKSFPYAALPVLIASMVTGKPIHYDWTDHESEYVRGVYRHRVWPFLIETYEKAVPKFSATVTVASRELEKSQLLAKFSKRRVFQCPATVDTDTFVKNAEAGERVRKKLGIPLAHKVFLFLGGLEPGTYVDVILQSVRDLAQEGKSDGFCVMVIGGGTLLNGLKRLAQDFKIASKVHFTGILPYDALSDFISSADVGLAPYNDTAYVRSKSPVKLVEYLSYGLPIITNRVGDFQELSGDCGIYMDTFTKEELTQKMKLVLEMDAKSHKMLSQKCRERAVKCFDYRATARIFESAYEVCLSAKADD